MEQRKTWKQVIDRVAEILIILFVLEATAGGSGHLLSFGPISLRMGLFALCFVVTLPNVFSWLRQLLRCPNLWIAVIFGVYLLISAALGLGNGNKTGYVWADISTFLALALMPGFLATIRTQKQVNRLLDTLYFGAVLVALATVVIHFLYAFLPSEDSYRIYVWVRDHSMGSFATTASGMQRLFFKSQIFLQVALFLGFWKLWKTEGIGRWLLFACEGLMLFAVILSYTRGFWLGLVISAAALLVLEPKFVKKYLLTVGVVAAILAGMFLSSWAAYGKPVAATEFLARMGTMSGAVTEVIPIGGNKTEKPNDDKDKNDKDKNDKDKNPVQQSAANATKVRQKTLAEMSRRIGKRPVFGSGLGTNLDGIRKDGRTEYMYLDMLMKGGIVGLVLFIATFFMAFFQLLWRWYCRKRAKLPTQWEDMRGSVLIAAYAGVAATSWLNPFMNNPMGIMLLMVMTAAVCAPVQGE